MSNGIEVDLTQGGNAPAPEPPDAYAHIRKQYRSIYQTAQNIADGEYYGEIEAMYPASDDCVVTLIRVVEGPEAGKVIRKFSNLTSEASKKLFKHELTMLQFEVKSRRELIERGAEIIGRQVKFSAETNDKNYPSYRLLGLGGPAASAPQKPDW